MDYRDSPAESAFRTDLRQWFAETIPKFFPGERRPSDRLSPGDARRWSRALFDAGYSGLTWPQQYGGRGLPVQYQAIFLEEQGRAQAPEHLGIVGIGHAGPTIIAHGTPEQKATYLAPILSGEDIWCQGFSEPDSGSDLAAVRTRARLEGDRWIVDGQKIWSSFAQIADQCILLVRTDPTAIKHAGLTYLLVDMKSPGIEIRPIRQITGDAEFNEIFFTGVEVPADAVLGEVGKGWQVAMTTLMHERATTGLTFAASLDTVVNRLIQYLKEVHAQDNPLVRDQLARIWVDLQGLRFTNYRSLAAAATGTVPGPEGSIVKLVWSMTNQAATKLAQSVAGPAAQVADLNDPWRSYWVHEQLRSRANSIEAGTSEILRNIVAERVLGLPRSR
jgi:alkylation response protein AidB-like acyl-CoA dehydrogenase